MSKDKDTVDETKDPIEFITKAIDDYMTHIVPADAGSAQRFDTKTALIAGIVACMDTMLLIKDVDDLTRLNNFIEAETLKILLFEERQGEDIEDEENKG